MEAMTSGVNAILSVPFLVVSLVVVALVATARKTIKKLKPSLEGNKWYKAFLPWVTLAVGVGLACAAKGIGQFEATWGYVVLLGMLAGFFSSWIWGAIKQFAGRWTK